MTLFRTLGSRKVEITHPDRIMFPRDGITKGDLVDYYVQIVPAMLPFMRNRALTMYRFPQGIDHEGFFHKDAPEYFPSWIKRVTVQHQEINFVHYVVCNDAATLAYLANYGVLTPHLWLSKIDKLDYPDHLIFDLDPARGCSFEMVVWAALEVKKLIEGLNLVPFAMLTGSRGVHVWVPLKRTHTFDVVRQFAHACSDYLVNKFPDKLTLEMRKNKRGQRIFVDFLRNGFGATAVAPYAVRAHDGAPVAMPVSWDELQRVSSSQQYTIHTAFKHYENNGNPWKHFDTSARLLRR